MLQAFGAGTTDWHVDLCRAVGRPNRITSGGNERKRHFNADGFFGRLARQPHDFAEPLGGYTAIEREG